MAKGFLGGMKVRIGGWFEGFFTSFRMTRGGMVWGLLVMMMGGITAVLPTHLVYAHADLRQASPEPGATVKGSPAEIRLLFNEPIQLAGSSITLFGEGFRNVEGVETVNGGRDPALLVAVVPDLEPGNYTVQWTAVSVDGHDITGSYAFTVATFFVTWRQASIGGMAVLLLFFLLRLYRVRQQ